MRNALILLLCLCSIALCAKHVTYEQFGAKGDGKTDDLLAIVKAHDYANENNLPVRANDKATYLLGGADKIAIVKTNTNWGKAKFIIDDRKVEQRYRDIFKVESKLKPIKIKSVGSLKKNAQTLDLNLKTKSLIAVKNIYQKRYIRHGMNAGSGDPQEDLFIIDTDNKIDPKNPILWDFDEITSMIAYPIDKEQLVIEGGEFTTIANQMSGVYLYHYRGILINRSNVLIQKIKHYIKGEGEVGQPYSGFITSSFTTDVHIKDILFTGHKLYWIKNPNNTIPMGSYDLNIAHSLNVIVENCTQTNDINDWKLWGVMHSKNSKNITYKKCKLSRFDAHQGVYNATIIDSELGHAGINLIGEGTFILENSIVNRDKLIELRGDYGATWDGEIIIRNVVYNPVNYSSNNRFSPVIISCQNTGGHYFGYDCYFPRKIVIENLKINNACPERYNEAILFTGFNHGGKYPYIIDGEVIIKNLDFNGQKKLKVSNNNDTYKNLKITYK